MSRFISFIYHSICGVLLLLMAYKSPNPDWGDVVMLISGLICIGIAAYDLGRHLDE